MPTRPKDNPFSISKILGDREEVQRASLPKNEPDRTESVEHFDLSLDAGRSETPAIDHASGEGDSGEGASSPKSGESLLSQIVTERETGARQERRETDRARRLKRGFSLRTSHAEDLRVLAWFQGRSSSSLLDSIVADYLRKHPDFVQEAWDARRAADASLRIKKQAG